MLHVFQYSPLEKGLVPTLVGNHQERARIRASMLKDLSWAGGTSTASGWRLNLGFPTPSERKARFWPIHRRFIAIARTVAVLLPSPSVHCAFPHTVFQSETSILHFPLANPHRTSRPCSRGISLGTSLTPSGTSTVFPSTPCSWCKPQTEALAICWANVFFCLLHSLDCKFPAQALS